MIFTETERAFYCLQPAAGEHCGRPKGHADDCCTEALQEDIVDFQDAREGDVLVDIRERLILDMPDYGFTGIQINAVLEILDMEFLRPEEAK